MSVEGLLAQMKAAAPSSRHAPAMERQVHAGLLAQVMQHHLDVGGADSRGDGLTMQQLAAARQLDRQPPRRWSRPDNVHRNTARPPPGARQSCASQGSALGTQAAPRAKPGSALGTQAAPSAKPGSALGTQAAPRGGAAKGTAAPPGQWQAHMAGQGWPVSEAVVDAFLEDLRGAAAGGIARYMQSERERRHGALYIADIGDIPDGRKYRFRHACPSAHPGVCVSQDASIYQTVMDVSRALDAFLGMDGVGKLFAFMGSQDRPPAAGPPAPRSSSAPLQTMHHVTCHGKHPKRYRLVHNNGSCRPCQ